VKKSIRDRLLALLTAVIVVGIVIYGYRAKAPPAGVAESGYRMPAGKPLLEPDRPDLIGDPGIANDNEEKGDAPDE